MKIEIVESGTFEEYSIDENEKAQFVKKERFHSIGSFPKYDVNFTPTGKEEEIYTHICDNELFFFKLR